MTCVVAALIALAPGAAHATGLSAPVADCNTHARLTQHYSVQQLRSALATMPADIKEYTNCPDVLQRALLAQLGGLHSGGSGGSGQGGGSFLPTSLVVVLALLLVAGAGFAVYAWRQRRS